MNRLKEEIARRKREVDAETKEVASRHMHGRKMTDDQAMRRPQVRAEEARARRAPKRMARLAMFQPEDTNKGLELDDGEVADRVAQDDILEAVDEQTKRKKFSITLDQMGPYKCEFSYTGTDVALVGLRGHLASFRWQSFKLEGETQLKDRCTDVKYLVDNSMLAVAQKRFVYMYTKAGVEMHVLPNMANCDKLEYLPNHMLLCASSSQYSVLHYMDVSTGKTVASKTPANVKDPTNCISRNPANGILGTGDIRGLVKLWSPTVEDPLVQLKAHKGAVRDVKFHPDGRFALSLGVDNKFKIWDLRTLRVLEEYGMSYTADAIDVSAKGLVALGGGTSVQIWKDLFSTSRPRGPHMKHNIGYGNIVNNVAFCPYEDVLGIGHSKGFCTMLVPGSGEANPDIFRANPYETEAHRKSRVVSSLLDKLPPETISMDLQIAGVDTARLEEYNEKLQKQRKMKGIKERKKAAREGAPRVQPKGPVDPDDEVDEELGVREGGVTAMWKPKKELQKERKMQNWQKKDSADKVRSKQTMRTSKIAKQSKQQKLHERLSAAVDDESGAGPSSATKAGKKTTKKAPRGTESTFDASGAIGHGTDDVPQGDGAPAQAKRSRAERRPSGDGDDDVRANAALRRFMR